ncbi:MAG: GlsB/YeaQ/YmgE family stress response membrane protein [Paludibacteraceae bacterium]|nr:GlsB/YeaQ/YmgE family stress response membrane protein [Paludibacteraceae bacterium]
MQGILLSLLFGAIAGFLGSKIFSGSGKGLLLDIIIGIVGGFLGGWIFGLLGINIGGAGDIIGQLIVAVLGSILLLWIISKVIK